MNLALNRFCAMTRTAKRNLIHEFIKYLSVCSSPASR
jgi:hypothetical protein